MEHTKAQIQLLRFWCKNRLKPFVRIEPRISHLNVDFFKDRETNKVFNDSNLSLIKGSISLKDILALNLPQEDIKGFILIHCPELLKKLNKI